MKHVSEILKNALIEIAIKSKSISHLRILTEKSIITKQEEELLLMGMKNVAKL